MAPPPLPDPASAGRDVRILTLIGTGHFLSHFYMLCLPPLFLIWQAEFGVSFAELGLAVALMSGVTAVLQTPVGFLVDRFGARPFLVGGVLLMTLSITAMAFAPGYWAILLLATLSGVGNSVNHPADYAIMGGSIDKSRIGRAFAVHTFTGNLGFAFGPPVVAAMLLVVDWRTALMILGLAGVPVVGAILWQARILQDQAKPKDRSQQVGGRELLLSRTILSFFGFFLLTAMASTAIQAFVITLLGKLWGTPVAVASLVLTGYMVGATFGTLVGGWLSDRFAARSPTGRMTVLALGLGVAALFLLPFLGTALLCVLLAAGALWQGGEGAIALAVGALAYLLGPLAVTMAFNVPLNNRLARVDLREAQVLWPRYANDWLRWNHVRTALGALSIALLPSTTSPSAASASPAATSTSMPGSRSLAGTRRVEPSGAITDALLPIRPSSAPIPARVRVRISASRARPASRKNSSITALSK